MIMRNKSLFMMMGVS